MDLNTQIEEFLAAYAEAYNRQDYDALLAMWDTDDPDVLYLAEEADPPMQGWDALRHYFNPRPGVQVLEGIRNRYSRVCARELAPDLALATYRLDFEIKVRGLKAMASWDRVVAVFRKRGTAWKLTAYAEAPMSPLTMVRRMLQDAVGDDFAGFVAGQQAR